MRSWYAPGVLSSGIFHANSHVSHPGNPGVCRACAHLGSGRAAQRTLGTGSTPPMVNFPAAARELRKAGGHSQGILVLGVCSDLLALFASRLGGGLKLALPGCPQCIDLPQLGQIGWSRTERAFFVDRPNDFALPHRRQAGWRRDGCGLQGRGH
jgi:hypothetical protein